MKIYYISYYTQEKGELEAFGSKREAQRRLADIRSEVKQDEAEEDRESRRYDHVFWDIREVEFPVTKEGMVAAFNDGADSVPK